jgi:membrane associated rhomboid family serine protease
VRSGGRIPVVTLLLLAANLAAAFTLLLHPGIAFDFGFRPSEPRPFSALTSLFLHANVLHLLGNMVFLAAVGGAVEQATGSLRFALVYFLSGLAGVAAHFLMMRHLPDAAPYIGASGAIAGCAAYYTIRYMSLRVPVAPHLAMSILAVAALWLFLQVLGAFVQIGESAGTAYWAHLGGFGMGIVLSFVFRAPDLGQIQADHEVLERMNERGPAAAVVAAQKHLERHPRDIAALTTLADAYAKLGEREREADTLMALLDLVSVDQQPDVVRRLSALGRVSRIPVLRRLQLADRARATAPGVSRALLRSVVEGPEDSQRPDALLALAALEREQAPERAAELLEELQRTYPLHTAVELARKRGWLT